MTAADMIARRTGLDAADVRLYNDMAGARVRLYLELEDSADITKYAPTVADIAIALWDADSALEASKGVKSSKYSEGSVSEELTYSDPQTTRSQCEDLIAALLTGLDRYKRSKVRFL